MTNVLGFTIVLWLCKRISLFLGDTYTHIEVKGTVSPALQSFRGENYVFTYINREP
jgi:hypothetical protein